MIPTARNSRVNRSTAVPLVRVREGNSSFSDRVVEAVVVVVVGASSSSNRAGFSFPADLAFSDSC